jgi:GT2 family glycosyltransferase
MMRRMFDQVESEFIWWFDDDSYITDPKALPSRLEIVRSAKSSVVMWGHKYFVNHEKSFSRGQDVVGFIKSASWYRGKPPPSWEPGGRGESNFKGKGTGDGRWFFMTGGSWLIRTSAVRELDWPDRRLIKCADDVFLSEAIRQHGWDDKSIGPMHVAINTELRRGEGEDQDTMARQCISTLGQTTKAKNTDSLAGQVK